MIDKPTFSNYNQYIPKFLPFNKLAPVLNVEAGYTRNHFVQISEMRGANRFPLQDFLSIVA